MQPKTSKIKATTASMYICAKKSKFSKTLTTFPLVAAPTNSERSLFNNLPFVCRRVYCLVFAQNHANTLKSIKTFPKTKLTNK